MTITKDGGGIEQVSPNRGEPIISDIDEEENL
jgi:hypothetical protein